MRGPDYLNDIKRVTGQVAAEEREARSTSAIRRVDAKSCLSEIGQGVDVWLADISRV
jgi:hypothetical protein